MKYTSITRSFRGYNYQTDWQTSDEWREEMKRQEQADNEIEWSVLVFVPSGMPVLQFSRGREIILLEKGSQIMNEERENDSRASSCSLWRDDWVEREGKMERVKNPDLFVWACVNTNTGQVEMDIQQYDDELSNDLVGGWEWRRLRLDEANATEKMTMNQNEPSN